MPVINYTRPPMAPYQTEIMDCPQRFATIEASTKAGKTASMIVWLFEQAIAIKNNQGVDWVAPVFAQAKIAFDRMKAQVNDRNFFKANESRLVLTMPHGAMLRFKSGDNPDSLYGDDSYATVVDEASRMKEASWLAVRSTLTATRGKCKLIGNVKGRKNFFYKMAQRAKGGEPDYFYKKITAYDAVAAGILDAAEIEQARRDLPEMVFKELYEAEATEDGTNPFGSSYIQKCTYQMSTLPAVCFGVDLAKKRDWTAIAGLDKNRHLCYFDRFQLDWDVTTQRVINLPQGPINMDATGVGDPIFESVQNVRQNVKGTVYTPIEKQNLIRNLALSIQGLKIQFPGYGESIEGLPENHPGRVKFELEQFETEYTEGRIKYNAPEGMTDDCVNALALANDIWAPTSTYGHYSVW